MMKKVRTCVHVYQETGGRRIRDKSALTAAFYIWERGKIDKVELFTTASWVKAEEETIVPPTIQVWSVQLQKLCWSPWNQLFSLSPEATCARFGSNISWYS